ncbi:MAG TPA: peptidase M13, partial [Dysgonomonas sp.]|nr:peptidase M13 [Dysgonomonas sp.]
MIGAALTSCKEKAKTQEQETIMDKGLRIENLDTNATPGDDFYRYATGGWADANPIPDEYSRYGSFDQLREQNEKQIKELIEELGEVQHENGSNAQKIGDLYKLGMDSVKLNDEKAQPIMEQLAEINAASSIDDIIRLAGKIRRYASTPYMGFYVGADDKNSSMNIVHLYQSGLGLGDRDYYLNEDEKSEELRQGYFKLINEQFKNAGYTDTDAETAAKAVMKIETALAKAHFEKEKTRVPELNYHKIGVATLNDSVAKF